MDSEQVDNTEVSLPGAGETEHQTVLERLNSDHSLDSKPKTYKPTDNENETDEVDFIVDSSIGELLEDKFYNSGDNNNISVEKPIENNLNCFNLDENLKEILEVEKIVIDEIQIKCTPIEDEYKKPRVPLQTYCWEDLRRSKEKGGYPWTHLYKPPLGPDDEPEIVLRYRSKPRTKKKIKEKLLIEETTEKKVPLETTIIPNTEKISKEELTENQDNKTSYISTENPPVIQIIEPPLNQNSSEVYPQIKCCHPLVHKIKTMADKHFHHKAQPSTSPTNENRPQIKKIYLAEGEHIPLHEEQPILRLRESPKAGGREITSYVVREDSDDILDIINLEDSPNASRRITSNDNENKSVVVPDEIIHLPLSKETDVDEELNFELQKPDDSSEEPTIAEIIAEEIKNDPPKKAPRKKKEHHYEDIEDYVQDMPHDFDPTILQSDICTPKISLKEEDNKILGELHKKLEDLDQLESSSDVETNVDKHLNPGFLAPISSIDSTSSDEDRKPTLPTLSEEMSDDQISKSDEIVEEVKPTEQKKLEHCMAIDDDESELKSILQNEERKASLTRSPGSEKKVTFSASTEKDDENSDEYGDDVREDVNLQTSNGISIDHRWSKMSDHEYEPIGEPVDQPQNNNKINDEGCEGAVGGVGLIGDNIHQKRRHSDDTSPATDKKLLRTPINDDAEDNISMQELQQQIEDRFFHPSATTLNEALQRMSTVTPKASLTGEEPDFKRKKGMMSSIQDKGRDMQSKIRTQAGKVKTKLRGVKKTTTESPVKVKERKKFKAPELSKFKASMPKIGKPEFSGIKTNIQKFKSKKKTDSNVLTITEEETITQTLPEKNVSPQVIITLPVDIPAPVEVPPPVPSDEPKKSRFSRPDLTMPKFNLSEKFASLRSSKEKTEKVIEGEHEKSIINETPIKKSSKFSDRFSSLRPSKTISESPKMEEDDGKTLTQELPIETEFLTKNKNDESENEIQDEIPKKSKFMERFASLKTQKADENLDTKPEENIEEQVMPEEEKSENNVEENIIKETNIDENMEIKADTTQTLADNPKKFSFTDRFSSLPWKKTESVKQPENVDGDTANEPTPEMLSAPRRSFSQRFASMRGQKQKKDNEIEDDPEKEHLKKISLGDRFAALRKLTHSEKHKQDIDDEATEITPSSTEASKKSKFSDRFQVFRPRSSSTSKAECEKTGKDIDEEELTEAPKKSRFRRPEIPKFNLPDKFPSFGRSRSNDAEKNMKHEGEPDENIDNELDEALERPTRKKRFSKPEMPKFKIPNKLKLKRSKSLKESTPITVETVTTETVSVEKPPKSGGRFDFATYPRFLSKLKKTKKNTNVEVGDDEDDNVDVKIEFPRMSREAVRKVSLHSEENESGKFKQYDDDINRSYRESSLEKRMRADNERNGHEFDEEDGIDEEYPRDQHQKQLDEYDKENREIHQLSGQRTERQPVHRTDSDLNSEDEKILEWVRQEKEKNKTLGREDSDLHSDEIENVLKFGERYQDFEKYEKNIRELTPYTNQETQSSGSSSQLRAKGVLEEIDDDEFFLRKKGISQENFPINEYISSALREGFKDPVNTLAQVGQYDAYYPNINTPSDKFSHSIESEDIPQEYHRKVYKVEPYPDDDFTNTFPPNKPTRRNKKTNQFDNESYDQQVPDDDDHHHHQYYNQQREGSFYENEHMEGIEQPNIMITPYGNFTTVAAEPPAIPKRRKKNKTKNYDQDDEELAYINEKREPVHEVFTKVHVPPRRWTPGPSPSFNDDEVVVHRTEHEYIVPHTESDFKESPIPPRRSRSRSHSHATDDDRTSRGVGSFTSENNLMEVEEPRCIISTDPRDGHGYAIIKKDPPPRPPAPLRRKKSTQSLNNERQFHTMPTTKKEGSPPSRPHRNYTTIAPVKPPRARSQTSLNSNKRNASLSSNDVTPYEEVDDHTDSHRDLQSGEVINKMKYRPLPPPPRPPREKKSKKPMGRGNLDDPGDKPDHDGAGERIFTNEIDIEDGSKFEKDSNQTTQIGLQSPQTLQEILKKEQEAEMERARQLAEAKNLERGIQRFRESSQRNFSERSRASTNDRPKTPGSRPGSRTGSRPITPAAMIIERRTSTPIDNSNLILTDASITMQPLELGDFDDNEIAAIEDQMISHINDELARSRDDEELKELNIDNSYIERLKGDAEDTISNVDNNEVEELNKNHVEPIPMVPPRRKSSILDEYVSPPQSESKPTNTGTKTIQTQTSDATEPTSHTQFNTEQQPESTDRLQVGELNVDRLNVNALVANQIIVSDLQSSSLSTQELESKSGNLRVQSIDLPPGFIEEIVERVRNSEQRSREHSIAPPIVPPLPSNLTNIEQLNVEENTRSENTVNEPIEIVEEKKTVESEKKKIDESPPPPARPPLPQGQFFPEYFPFSIPPASFYQLRNPSDDDPSYPINNTTTQQHQSRRRRHQRRHESTSEEENPRESSRNGRSVRTANKSPEPSITELTGQIFRACSQAVQRSCRAAFTAIRDGTLAKDTENRQFHIAIIIMIVIIAGLILFGMGRGGSTVHTHHWDYFNPPGNGSPQLK